MDKTPRTIGVLVIVHGGLMAALSFDCKLVPDITDRVGERAKQIIETDMPELGTPSLNSSQVDPQRPDRFVLLGRPTADPTLIARLLNTIRDEFDVEVQFETVDGDALETQFDRRAATDPIGLIREIFGDGPQAR